MRSRKAMLPGLCKTKGSPMKKTTNPPTMLDEVKLTDSYPNKRAKRRGEKRKLEQKLHSNPVIQAIHSKTDETARSITKGADYASTILPIGGFVKGAKGTKKIFDTFNKIAKNRAKQNKIIEESLKKKGYKIMPTKSSGWTGK